MCVVALGAAMGATTTAGAATVGTIMASSIALSGYSAYSQAQMGREQASYQKAVNNNNAVMAEYERQDAIERGEEAVQAHYRKVSAFRGTQEASMAARGLDISTGTPLDILSATDYFGAVDARTIQSNAERAGWSSTVDAMNFRSAAKMQGAARSYYSPLLATGTSLLGGASNVASTWASRQ